MAIGDGMKGEEKGRKGEAVKSGGGFVRAEKYVIRRAK